MKGSSCLSVPYEIPELGILYETSIHHLETLANGKVITMHIFQVEKNKKILALENQLRKLKDRMHLMDTFFENCPVHLGNDHGRYI